MASKREKEKQKYRKTNAFALAKEQKSSGGESTSFKLPDGFEEFKPEVGVYELDVCNFLAGKNNRRADEGWLHYESEYQLHWVPTIDGKARPYVCLTKWKKKCPVCERHSRPLPDDDPKDFTDRIKGKTMHLMNVRVLKKDNKPVNEEKFRVFSCNHYNKGKGFFEQLLTLIGMDESYGEFADWESGLTLRVSFVEDSFPGGKYIRADRLDFLPRKAKYDESVLENLCCLDELFIEKPYVALKSVLENGVEEAPPEDEEDEKPKAAAKYARKAEPEEEEEEEEEDERAEPEIEKGDVVLHEKLGRCTVAKVNADGTLNLVDKSSKAHKNVDADEVEAVVEDEPEGDDEEDEAPPPKKAPGKANKQAAEPEDDGWESDDDDEEDEEEEEEPAPKKRGRGKK